MKKEGSTILEQLNIGWWFLILLVGIVTFVFFGHTLGKVLRFGWYGVLYLGIGFVMLFFFNMVGQLIDFNIPLNFVTALTVGFLGLPGLITLILVKILIIP